MCVRFKIILIKYINGLDYIGKFKNLKLTHNFIAIHTHTIHFLFNASNGCCKQRTTSDNNYFYSYRIRPQFIIWMMYKHEHSRVTQLTQIYIYILIHVYYYNTQRTNFSLRYMKNEITAWEIKEEEENNIHRIKLHCCSNENCQYAKLCFNMKITDTTQQHWTNQHTHQQHYYQPQKVMFSNK